jgi:hypothetical protein
MRLYVAQDSTSEYDAFRLPCHLHFGRCTIYNQWRPAICGDYRCRLLEAVEAGSRSVEDCMSVVEETRALARELISATPEDGRSEGTPLDVPQMLAAAAFESLMVRYFRRPATQET